jgi:NDP-4-keto-2,6-dideoxyhexose 3-C-methyltransferase
MKVIREHHCRVCNGDLETVLDLGEIYLSGFVRMQEEGQKAPLALSRCNNCGLVQLRDSVDLDNMYRQYWYSSSLNKSMVGSLKDVVTHIESLISFDNEDVVVDIGCNDGTLLNLYSKSDLCKVGFDPALNLPKPYNCYFINDYFRAKDFTNICGVQKAKVVTAIAMYYDLPNPVEFTKEVASILKDDGIFVIQFTDLLSMFKATAFDNICHEHLEYYRLKDVLGILDQAGLEAINVGYNSVNGGSLRLVAGKKGAYDPSYSVQKFTQAEEDFFSIYGFEEFNKAIEIVKGQIENFFEYCAKKGSKVYLLGASTKGNTLLQLCGLTNKQVPYAAEVNKDKFGLRTVGSDISIIPEDEAFNSSNKPDYFLVPVWHFSDSLLNKEKVKKFILDGGKMVFPLPVFHIIDKEYYQHDRFLER